MQLYNIILILALTQNLIITLFSFMKKQLNIVITLAQTLAFIWLYYMNKFLKITSKLSIIINSLF